MTSAEKSDLPESVQHHLPAHAQEIHLAALNNAWKEYVRRGGRESLAHKVAWTVVKQQYWKSRKGWINK